MSEGAIGLLTGEVGAGKTVATRAALSSLEQSRYSVVYISSTTVGVSGIYRQIVSGLGESPKYFRSGLVAQLSSILSSQANEKGRKVVVVVDEAHLLSQACLEELRITSSAEMDSASAMTLLLVGQPQLRRTVKLSAFAALDQRIATRYVLPGMERQETGDYINHHTSLAGRSDLLFSDDAADLIHQGARGLPRSINNLAIQSLIATYVMGKAIVDESAVRKAIGEVNAQ